MTTTLPTALSEILELARAAAAAGDTSRARHYFRNLIEIDPTLLDAWLGYAACTSVLSERRALYERALALDPEHPEARSGLDHAHELLAAGKLVLAAERPEEPAPPAVHLQPAPPPFLIPANPRPLPKAGLGGLLAVWLLGLGLMGALTAFGIFTLTSFWGFMLAFLAGPAVSELMVRASRRVHRAAGGRALQIAAGVGMILGGLAAMALGGLLLQLLGLPLPAEAVAMARNSGVATDPASVLLNNPGLLVFVSSAVGATVFRLR
jgi:tetratricopeptide (TPR) repeat protein